MEEHITPLITLMQAQLASYTKWSNAERKAYARMYGQAIYDMPPIRSGYASEKAILAMANNQPSLVCHDHAHGRQRGGNRLVRLLEECAQSNTPLDVNAALHIITEHRMTNYVTKEENQLLRKHQIKCSGPAAYRRAGIRLLYALPLFTSRGRRSSKWKRHCDQLVEIIQSPTHPHKRLGQIILSH